MTKSAVLSDTDFELDGDLGELGLLVEQVNRFCRAAGLDDEAAFELNLVLEELFTNTVRHGGCSGVRHAVWVQLKLLEHGGVAVDYRDCGVPFDPTSAAVPELAGPLSERQPGGLGIHLVRQIMGDLRYQRAGSWNRLTMRREGKADHAA